MGECNQQSYSHANQQHHSTSDSILPESPIPSMSGMQTPTIGSPSIIGGNHPSTPTSSGNYYPNFPSSINLASSLSSPNVSSNKSTKHGSTSSTSSSLSMDRAAFLLIRIKRVFQKKKRKGNNTNDGKDGGDSSKSRKLKPPMLRARTLPAIIPPAFNVVQAPMFNRIHNINTNDFTENVFYSGINVRSPELLQKDSGNDLLPSMGTPRESVSSNSSNGSSSIYSNNKTDKRTSFSRFTRLLSNNSTPKVLTPNSGSFWPGRSAINNTLCQDGLTDASCFFWNNNKNQNKMKRTGSVDSLLSPVNGPSELSNLDQSNTEVTDPSVELNQSKMQNSKQLNRMSKVSPLNQPIGSTMNVNQTKSSTYYLGSMLNTEPFGSREHASFYGETVSRSSIGSSKIPGKRQMSIDINTVLVDSLKKSDRKRWEKLSKFNFDQQALFSAVENENFERTQMIVETTDVDLNSTNSDGFTPLDISLMLLNIPIIKYLQSCGAREGDAFANRNQREFHLISILSESERCVHDLSICLRQSTASGSSLSSALMKEKERQLIFWERRHRLLQRLKRGLDLLEPPPSPLSVHVEVVGSTSLLVHYFPPIRLQEKKNIITKYKIEWSDNSFETIFGSVEIHNLASKHEYVIEQLNTERCYQIRIASGNCKGFSDYCYPLMNQSIPSSWKSLDSKISPISSSERMIEIDNLFREIIQSRQIVIENELKRLSIETESGGGGGGIQSQKRVRKSIKNFFGTANKFQRVMKRGIFFASLIYHEQRVLVTNDEVLPIIEIDDIYPSTLQNDFYWLLKIACTWDDIKMFRRDMEKSQSSVAHFRTKILLAIEQMQSSLGLSDLGQLFYKPLRDSEGTVVLCTIRALSDPKQISCLSLRWLPLVKLHKRLYQQQQAAQAQQQAILQKESFSERVSDSGISLGGYEYSPRLIGDILVSTLDEMIEFHQACNTQLPRGLYVGYVKLRSSVDMMSVMVSKEHPNILPHAKIRDNPHISKTEWSALKYCLRPESVANAASGSLSSSLIHCNLSASASQLYLSTLQQQKEVIESKEFQSSTNTCQNYGNLLSANNSPTLQGVNESMSTIPTTSNTPTFSTTKSSHLTQLFQLATNNRNFNNLTNSLSELSQTSQPRLTFSQKLSFQQLLKFLQMLSQTAGHFLQSIGVTDGDHADAHRLYSLEVIELSSDVSLILLLPPVDDVCSIFNQSDSLNQMPNLIYLPLKIFELIHMHTYQPNFTRRYSRISAMLELDIMVAQQAQREAFSSAEVTTAKTRLNQLQEFQTQLDEYCRSMRWIMDVVAFARDRQLAAGIPLFDVQYTLNCVDKQLLDEDNDDRLFHVPAISLSTPTDHPTINIQSECNSTPSSPPAMASIPIPSDNIMGRRKSRDDSFLEEHHRMQNHFNSVHHHRFHNQYGCTHQKNGTAFPFQTDSLDSGSSEINELLPSSLLNHQSINETIPKNVSNFELLPPNTIVKNSNNSTHSLNNIDFKQRSNSNGLLSTNISNTDDIRRCVSASKLTELINTSDSTSDFSSPLSSNPISMQPRSENSNYFFRYDMEMYDNGIPIKQSTHSIDSISDISIICTGISRNSITSINKGLTDDVDSSSSQSSFNSMNRYEYENETCRPLSRATKHLNESQFDSNFIPEEEEEALEFVTTNETVDSLLDHNSSSIANKPIPKVIWTEPSIESLEQDRIGQSSSPEPVLSETDEKTSIIGDATTTATEQSNKTTGNIESHSFNDQTTESIDHLQQSPSSSHKIFQPTIKMIKIKKHNRKEKEVIMSRENKKLEIINDLLTKDPGALEYNVQRQVKLCEKSNRMITIQIGYRCSHVPTGTMIKLAITDGTIVGDIICAIVSFVQRIEDQLNRFYHCGGADKIQQQRFINFTSTIKHQFIQIDDANKLKIKQNYVLLAIYSNNIKQLNWNLSIFNLHTPWNRAKLCIRRQDKLIQRQTCDNSLF